MAKLFDFQRNCRYEKCSIKSSFKIKLSFYVRPFIYCIDLVKTWGKQIINLSDLSFLEIGLEIVTMTPCHAMEVGRQCLRIHLLLGVM